jgi:Holliday junction resolvase RusA-like endonuclease
MIQFKVPGVPQGKGRARFGNGRTYTPAKTVAYEGLIALAGQQAMEGRDLLDQPVQLTVTASFAVPKSWNARRKAEAATGMMFHVSKPDGDNILKAVGDGLNGIVWKDDSQIAMARIMKVYGEVPGLDVMVAPI